MPLFFMRTAESTYTFFTFAQILLFLLPLMSLSSIWIVVYAVFPQYKFSIKIMSRWWNVVMLHKTVMPVLLVYSLPCYPIFSYNIFPVVNVLSHDIVYHKWLANIHPLQLNSILYSGLLQFFLKSFFSDLGYYPRYHIPFSHHDSVASHLRKFLIFSLIYDLKNIE